MERTAVSRITGLVAIALLAIPAGVAAAQDEGDAAAPSVFSGHIDFGGQVRAGSVQVVDGVTQTRGYAHAPVIRQMSDPRLEGRVTISFDSDDYPGSAGVGLGTGTWRIQNEDGAWQGSYNIAWAEEFGSIVTTVLTGEGAYEGLVAVWEQNLTDSGWDLRGVIVPGAPPEAPTAP